MHYSLLPAKLTGKSYQNNLSLYNILSIRKTISPETIFINSFPMIRRLTRRSFLRNGVYAGCGGFIIPSLLDNNNFIHNNQPEEKLWKWSREAMFWEDTPRGVKCLICPNECTLKPGETSDCRNRINFGGKLYSIAYGNPCAVHIDPMEKKPLFHFLPGTLVYSIATAGCNFGCLNCQNWTISQASPKETANYDLMPDAVVDKCIASGCKSIAYTYSEPVTFYEYTYDTSVKAHKKGVFNTLHSNGYINEKPLRELAKHIDAANIDLKSFSESIYLKLNAGKLQPVLNALKILKQEGVWLEITNLIIPGWTDDMKMIRTMCKWLVDNELSEAPLHISRFLPQYKLTQVAPTPLPLLQQARVIALEEGIKYVYIGNVPGNEAENTYCPGCNKILIERKGYRILSNNILRGKCRFCGSVIPGKWE